MAFFVSPEMRSKVEQTLPSVQDVSRTEPACDEQISDLIAALTGSLTAVIVLLLLAVVNDCG